MSEQKTTRDFAVRRCPDCGRVLSQSPWEPPVVHKCPPRFRVTSEEDPDGEIVFSHSAESAAEQYVEEWEASAAEYPSLNGGETKVTVYDASDTEREFPTVFAVTGESAIVYR